MSCPSKTTALRSTPRIVRFGASCGTRMTPAETERTTARTAAVILDLLQEALRRGSRFLEDVRTVLVLEAVEDAGFDEAPFGLPRVLERGELEIDEDVVRVVSVAEDPLHRRLLARPRPVLVEHRPPRVVVADVDPRDDEARYAGNASRRAAGASSGPGRCGTCTSRGRA